MRLQDQFLDEFEEIQSNTDWSDHDVLEEMLDRTGYSRGLAQYILRLTIRAGWWREVSFDDRRHSVSLGGEPWIRVDGAYYEHCEPSEEFMLADYF